MQTLLGFSLARLDPQAALVVVFELVEKLRIQPTGYLQGNKPHGKCSFSVCFPSVINLMGSVPFVL